jgi:hypothetical protein
LTARPAVRRKRRLGLARQMDYLAEDLPRYRSNILAKIADVRMRPERHIRTQPPRPLYDALLLPALNYAERDRLEQRLSLEEGTLHSRLSMATRTTKNRRGLSVGRVRRGWSLLTTGSGRFPVRGYAPVLSRIMDDQGEHTPERLTSDVQFHWCIRSH